MASMLAMMHYMDESNLEMVNTLTQKMGKIFNPLIRNTKKNMSCWPIIWVE